MSLASYELGRNLGIDLKVGRETDQQLRIGSLENPADIAYAARLMRQGLPVAAHMRGVYGIWINAANESARMRALNVKGNKDANTPFSTMMDSNRFLQFIDRSRLPKEALELMSDVREYQERTGAICHVRAPITAEAIARYRIPSALYSVVPGETPEQNAYYMHNLDPHGHEPMEGFVSEIGRAGMPFVAVSSFNDHAKGESEITNIGRATEFATEKGVKLLLRDPLHKRSDVRGSFPMVDLEKLLVIRDGHVPAHMLSNIIGIPLSTEGMKQKKWDYPNYPDFTNMDINPKQLRQAIILYTKGMSHEEIFEALKA